MALIFLYPASDEYIGFPSESVSIPLRSVFIFTPDQALVFAVLVACIFCMMFVLAGSDDVAYPSYPALPPNSARPNLTKLSAFGFGILRLRTGGFGEFGVTATGDGILTFNVGNDGTKIGGNVTVGACLFIDFGFIAALTVISIAGSAVSASSRSVVPYFPPDVLCIYLLLPISLGNSFPSSALSLSPLPL